jgi:hypothetical protein
MAKVFRYTGFGVLGLLGLVFLGATILYSLGGWKTSRTHNVQGQAIIVEITNDVLARVLSSRKST